MSLQEITLFPTILASPSPHLPLQGSLIFFDPPGLELVTAIPLGLSLLYDPEKERGNRDWDDVRDREGCEGQGSISAP